MTTLYPRPSLAETLGVSTLPRKKAMPVRSLCVPFPVTLKVRASTLSVAIRVPGTLPVKATVT